MTNIWIGVGRLTRDPELRYSESGKAVAPMRIAVPRPGEGDARRLVGRIRVAGR